MLDFLMLSIGCQIVFLSVYKLVFANERMYTFNRFFLLIGLLLSVALPFMSFEIITRTEVIESIVVSDLPTDVSTPVAVASGIDYREMAMWLVYSIVASALTIRFVRNLAQIIIGIKKNPKRKSGKSTLVLIDSPIAPYSFFKHIFVSKSAFENNKLAPQIITHEKTHTRQLHSIDVVLAELFQIAFWFNPLLPAYKRAIQLNHEFLADEEVLQMHSSAHAYQNLLLSYASFKAPLAASSLNFSLTKKRFEMMNITTPTRRILIKKIAAFVAIPLVTFAVSVDTIAQQITQNSPQDPNEYYADTRFKFIDKDGKVSIKNYGKLSDADKNSLAPMAHPSKAVVPGEKEIAAWQDKKQYVIWIDDRVQPNAVLKLRKASEFASFFSSFVHKNARSEKFPQPYQVHLYTPAFYDSFVKNAKAPAVITLASWDAAKKISEKAKKEKTANKSDIQAIPIVNYRSAETSAGTTVQETVYSIANVDHKPEYPGGLTEFYKYVTSKFVYPKPENGIYASGRVIVSFTISKTGAVTDVKILRSISAEIDDQIVSILKNSVKWEPAKVEGEAVSCSYQLPVAIQPE